MEIVIATQNPAKVREFKQMLGAETARFRDLSAYSDLREIAETGQSFEENAKLKASGYAIQCRSWAMADDSGLEVDALAGKPGIFSARWALMHRRGRGADPNNHLLLAQMEQVPDEQRTARFVCALALADETGRIVATVQDSWDGVILRVLRGNNGFGYDPLFYIPSIGRTAGQLSADEKAALSHRGKALRKMRARMAELNLEPDAK